MDFGLIQKMLYSYPGAEYRPHQMHQVLIDALQVISAFFKNNTTNKLCIVFPSKEYAAQWLAVPMVLSLIRDHYEQYKSEIIESYKKFKPGDKLILNDKAIVEWVGIKEIRDHGFSGPTFITKGIGNNSDTIVTIKFSDVTKLQIAPNSRQVLSSSKIVKKAYYSRNLTPTEKLLNIDTYGNKEFIKNNICLVSKYKYYDNIKELFLNRMLLSEYIQEGKINDNGEADKNSPLLVSNNLSTLALYVTCSSSVSKIIIDGYAAIHERGTDFADIDAKNIPTILITDLSENNIFENIGDHGFEFYNFTKEHLKLNTSPDHSPFYSFNEKLRNYTLFKLNKEICKNEEIENVAELIHSIEQDESNNDLINLRISLIRLFNLVSRIAHSPTALEISSFNSKINNLESLFQRSRMWLGDSQKTIEGSISLLKSIIEKIASTSSDKCSKLKMIMNGNHYDYIICSTEDEVNSLNDFLNISAYTQKPKIISVADVNDNLLSNRPVKAILTGWAKSNNINRILSSFLLSELTILFYPFENRYYTSLQKHNKKNNENIKPTITNYGVRLANEKSISKGFEDLYLVDEVAAVSSESPFDIVSFELKIDNTQYSKYFSRGNLAESCKAKRISFENNTFVYAAESHKFIVINELINMDKPDPNIHMEKFESLQIGDVIAFINTDTDVLVLLVKLTTKPEELGRVQEWTNLWKDLLKSYYIASSYNFKKLVVDLRKYGCKKHEVTIRTWLQDDNRIGPDDDADLKSIALMTTSEKLSTNIATVRNAIRQMTGLRMKASDKVREIIKNKLVGITKHTILNSRLEIQNLGSVDILKVIELNNKSEEIDKRFVHRLLQKEFI
jgi:hypothetical protein